jgi:hypothetical protein
VSYAFELVFGLATGAGGAPTNYNANSTSSNNGQSSSFGVFSIERCVSAQSLCFQFVQ